MIPAPPTEFELDGKEYRIGKLNAFQQLHVSRKIAPILPPLIPVVVKVMALVRSSAIQMPEAAQEPGGEKSAPAPDAKPSIDLTTLPELLQPLADAFGGMTDEAAEYVVGTCLSVLRRKNAETGNWTPIWNASAKVLMFSDLNDLSTTIGLVVRVVRESLGPFISGLLTIPPGETKAPTE